MEVLILLLEECAQPKISIVFFRQDRSNDEIITVISRAMKLGAGHQVSAILAAAWGGCGAGPHACCIMRYTKHQVAFYFLLLSFTGICN